MWKAMNPRPMISAERTTPPLINACDFFIFLSSRAAAGGRPGIVVAKSDMELSSCWDGLQILSRMGKLKPDTAMDIRAV